MAVDPKQLSEKTDRLSPLPELWEPLVELSLFGTWHPEKLVGLIERDLALSARVLTVANSEQYGKPGQVLTIPAAMQYLGLDMVQNLILSTPCNEIRKQALYGERIEYEEFWKHSVACSILCQRMAMRIAPGLIKEFKMAGLLHDLGKVYLNLQDAKSCGQIIPERGQRALLLQEKDSLQCTHVEAIRMLMERMGFPEIYRVGCGSHHDPPDKLDLGHQHQLLAACVGLADYLAYQMQMGDGGNPARLIETQPDLARVGLTKDVLAEIRKESEAKFHEVVTEIRPGTASLDRQFHLVRRAVRVLGRRSLFLNKNVIELSRLQEIHEDLNRSLDINQLLEQLAVRLGTIFSTEAIAFFLLLNGEPKIHFYSKLPVSEHYVEQCRERLLRGLDLEKEGTPALESHLLVPDATQGLFQLRDLRSVLALPLQGREGSIGRLGFFSSMSGSFGQSDENLATIIAGEIALALDRANWMRRTEILSITDELTGLNNHRRFIQILEHEFARSTRYKTNLCLVMLDIDHFKLLNDTYGHPQGDRMLKELAKILMETTRESDMVSRYGGEEFAIVLPSTDLEGGEISAERIRTAVEANSFPNPGMPPLNMTVSLGVAYYGGEEATTPQELIKKADIALYRAKEQGRNQTVIYG